MVGVQAVLDDFYCGDENCYDVLGVSATAKPKEISKAFRALSKKFHPDIRKQEPDDEKRREMENSYLMLNKAYETLNSVEKRKEYDAIVADGFRYRVLKRKYYGGGKNVFIHPLVPVILVLAGGSLLQHLNRNNMMAREKRRCMAEIYRNKKWLDDTAAKIVQANMEEEMAQLKKTNESEWEKRAFEINPVELILHVHPVKTDEIFALQVIKFPYTAVMFLVSFASEYRKPEEKLKRADKITKTANALGIPEVELIRCTDKTILSDMEKNLGDLDDLLKKKLWKPKNMNSWLSDRMEQELKKIPKQQRATARREMLKRQKSAKAETPFRAFQNMGL